MFCGVSRAHSTPHPFCLPWNGDALKGVPCKRKGGRFFFLTRRLCSRAFSSSRARARARASPLLRLLFACPPINQRSGPIPTALGGLASLNKLRLENNQLEGEREVGQHSDRSTCSARTICWEISVRVCWEKRGDGGGVDDNEDKLQV